MTKDELRKELKTGVKLEDIFKFTEGQDCLIYKGKFLPGIIGDDICYISDLSLVDIQVNKSIVKSYEIDSVMGRCYTTNDFIKECNGHENIAEDLFNYVDWQTPDINDFMEACAAKSAILDNKSFIFSVTNKSSIGNLYSLKNCSLSSYPSIKSLISGVCQST